MSTPKENGLPKQRAVQLAVCTWLLMTWLSPAVRAATCEAIVEQSQPAPQEIVVPEQAAMLLRPILDEIEELSAQRHHDDRRLSELLANLIRRKPRESENEALVVLMCFYIGESQEEEDAVIVRGQRMLRLLEKYQSRTPRIPGRSYPASMRKNDRDKSSAFIGAINAIKHGRKGTWDNPDTGE